jgi:hypothetical protein
MVSNKKIVNYKVVDLFEIYNFGLYISFLHLKSFEKLKNDFKLFILVAS